MYEFAAKSVFIFAGSNLTTQTMRKSILYFTLAAITIALTSCSFYTCPTYAKKVTEQQQKVARM